MNVYYADGVVDVQNWFRMLNCIWMGKSIISARLYCSSTVIHNSPKDKTENNCDITTFFLRYTSNFLTFRPNILEVKPRGRSKQWQTIMKLFDFVNSVSSTQTYCEIRGEITIANGGTGCFICENMWHMIFYCHFHLGESIKLSQLKNKDIDYKSVDYATKPVSG